METIPNAFLERFCQVVEAYQTAGKFSIVPAPAGKGDIVTGIAGYSPLLTRQWLDTANHRLSDRFDFCPEGITHNLAVDLNTGSYLDQGESAWSQKQDRYSLTPYIKKSLEYLKSAGIEATGVTSPWVFGIEVEPEYIHAITTAQYEVYNTKSSWYFLHMLHQNSAARPWVAYQQGDSNLVAIPSTVDDFWWQTIDSPRTDRDFISSVADHILTADGQGGKVRQVLNAGGWPIRLTHWQSLFSNGLETGLAVLEEVGQRVKNHLMDEVEWKTCSEIKALTLEFTENKAS